jgi:hypothetical protein
MIESSTKLFNLFILILMPGLGISILAYVLDFRCWLKNSFFLAVFDKLKFNKKMVCLYLRVHFPIVSAAFGQFSGCIKNSRHRGWTRENSMCPAQSIIKNKDIPKCTKKNYAYAFVTFSSSSSGIWPGKREAGPWIGRHSWTTEHRTGCAVPWEINKLTINL